MSKKQAKSGEIITPSWKNQIYRYLGCYFSLQLGFCSNKSLPLLDLGGKAIPPHGLPASRKKWAGSSLDRELPDLPSEGSGIGGRKHEPPEAVPERFAALERVGDHGQGPVRFEQGIPFPALGQPDEAGALLRGLEPAMMMPEDPQPRMKVADQFEAPNESRWAVKFKAGCVGHADSLRTIMAHDDLDARGSPLETGLDILIADLGAHRGIGQVHVAGPAQAEAREPGQVGHRPPRKMLQEGAELGEELIEMGEILVVAFEKEDRSGEPLLLRDEVALQLVAKQPEVSENHNGLDPSSQFVLGVSHMAIDQPILAMHIADQQNRSARSVAC
jgi:hypothetical protein